MNVCGEPECFAELWATRLECKACRRYSACYKAIMAQGLEYRDSLPENVKVRLGYKLSKPGAELICLKCETALHGTWYDILEVNGKRGIRMCDACEKARDAATIERAVFLGISPERLLELQTMSYKAYLKTPEWQLTRLCALNRADFKCQHCGYKDNLQVHHHTYATRGCERDEDLVVLCRHCHENNHGLNKGWWDKRSFHERMGMAGVV